MKLAFTNYKSQIFFKDIFGATEARSSNPTICKILHKCVYCWKDKKNWKEAMMNSPLKTTFSPVKAEAVFAGLPWTICMWMLSTECRVNFFLQTRHTTSPAVDAWAVVVVSSDSVNQKKIDRRVADIAPWFSTILWPRVIPSTPSTLFSIYNGANWNCNCYCNEKRTIIN